MTHAPPRTLDEQFAEMPDRVKVALFGLLDAAKNVSNASGLAEAADTMHKLQQISLPDSAKGMVKATESLLTAVSLELHVRRLQWAADEGFEGTEGFLAALAGGPFAHGEQENHHD